MGKFSFSKIISLKSTNISSLPWWQLIFISPNWDDDLSPGYFFFVETTRARARACPQYIDYGFLFCSKRMGYYH